MTQEVGSRSSFSPVRPAALLAAILVVASLDGGAAQTPGSSAPLRQQLEQRFDVLPVQDALVLRPKAPVRDVRWVEVSGGTISVNGVPASGAEVRDKLGDDAALILQLSYVEPAARAEMFRDAGGPAAAVMASRPRVERGQRDSDGGRFRFGGDITVPADELVAGDVVAVGGSIHVLGEVRGDVVAIGGAAELGPASRVGGDVTVIGGSLDRAPTARVDGEVVTLGEGAIGPWRARFLKDRWRWMSGGWTFGTAVALISTLTRVAILCLFAALVVLFGRDHVTQIGARAASEPLKAGAIGFLAQLLVLPLLIVTIVLLVVTIIGIPLLALIPFVLVVLALVALVGFTSVAHHVGDLLSVRFGWNPGGPYATTILGIVALVSPLLLARLLSLAGGLVAPVTFGLVLTGTVVEYIAWTVGFGAVALVRFRGPGPTPPPPSPPGPSPMNGLI